jgi:hypothetical protein
MTRPPRRVGSRWLGEFPHAVVRIECERCGPAGSYRRDSLMVRFGAEITLPDLLVALAPCDRRKDFARPCGARFTTWPAGDRNNKGPDAIQLEFGGRKRWAEQSAPRVQVPWASTTRLAEAHVRSASSRWMSSASTASAAVEPEALAATA